MDIISSRNVEQKSSLECRTKWGYGAGHVLNDLAASIWFSYALLFYKLSYGHNAYSFLVIGQATDAIVTTLISLFFDANFISYKLFKMGKYKTWYLIGTILFFLSFPLSISEASLIYTDRKLVYAIYVLAIVVSQTGWSFVQISHLSLINEISVNAIDRTALTSIRQAACIYTAIVVFALFWFTLAQSDTIYLTKKDIYVFSYNSYFITLYGMFHSVGFLIAIRENYLLQRKQRLMAIESANNQNGPKNQDTTTGLETKNNKEATDLVADNANADQTALRPMDNYDRCDWFKDLNFYKIAIIYMLARLYGNLPYTYIPLYLQEYLFLKKSSIAIVPLITHISGLGASFCANFIENNFGNKFHLLLGIVLGLVASFWASVGTCNNESFTTWQIYCLSIVIGMSMTIIKIASISLVSIMIGHNTKSISFVYGIVSCFEKVMGGVIIAVLEQYNTQKSNLGVIINSTLILEQQSTTTLNNLHAFDSSRHPTIFEDTTSICPNSLRPVIFYYYVIVYGDLIILLLLFAALMSIRSVDFTKT